MMEQRVRDDGEGGFALFYALLVVLVVGGVVAVTLASSTAELRQSAFELDFEDTVHVAEAGLESVMQQLVADNAASTPVTGPSGGQDVHDWAIAAATATTGGVYDLDALDLGEGEAVGIRPTGTHTEYVYGIGFVPSRDAFVDGTGAAYARVVRVQVGFTDTTLPGNHAVTVGGSMSISSNAYEITGTAGSLHANGAVAINNNNTDQGISYSGSCTATCGEANGFTGPVDEEPIPDLVIEDPWGTDDAIAIAAAGDWYDYCSGQWYQRAQTDTVPCTGTAVATPSGWAGLQLQNVTDPDAVFWIDDPGTVDLKKVEGPITVIARGDIDIGPSANAGAMVPRYPGLLVFTEGDLDIGGNASSAGAATPGIAYARGHLTLRGTMESSGIAYVARDATLVGSSYLGGGNGTVHYDGGAIADLGGDGTPLVLEWQEIR